MDDLRDTEITSDSAEEKRSWLVRPSVKLMPEFRGARVIEGENGGEQIIGMLFPWRQMLYHDSRLYLCDEHFKRFRVDDSPLTSQFVGGTKLASRLQHRSIKQWLTHGTEPIEFEPPNESIKGWYIQAPIVVFVVSGGVCYLFYSLVSGTTNNPYGISALYAIAILSPLILFALIAAWASWDMRPRERSFELVRLMPQGLIGECAAKSIVINWDELRSARIYPSGKGVTVQYNNLAGEQFWVCFPNPLRNYPIHIHGKPPKPRIFGADRYLTVQGFRFIIIGVALGFIAREVVVQLPNWVPHAPPFPPHFPKTIFWMIFVMPAMLGVMYIYFAIKTVPRVRRFLHAQSKRYDERKKRGTQTQDRSSTTR